MSKSIALQKWFEKTLKEEDIIKYDYSVYENVEVIGKGGFGIVYSANFDGKKVALKSLKCDEVNQEASKEFIKELKQFHAINFHPNINQFYGITRDPENKFMMVLQFANGGNLRQYLKNKWNDNTYEISLNEIIQISKQITNGLGHLHKNNIIHCDLHPKNILINDDKFLIADFGLSRQKDDAYSSSHSIAKGMPAYLDPHCYCQPGKKPDEKSDIYSLGVIFWELTSGIPPFLIATNGFFILTQAFAGYREQAIPGTQTDYAELFRKCWNAVPKERPTILKILEILNSISKRDTLQLIKNRNKDLIPAIDRINEQPQFYTTTHTDDLEIPRKSYYKLEKYEKSLEYLTKLLNFDPKNITALRTRGQTYCMIGKYANSLEDLNNVLEIDPNDAESLRARGKTYYNLGKYDESLKDLTESLEIEPDHPFALRSRGQIYFKLDRYEESFANLAKCLKVDPNNPNRAATLRLGGEVCYMLKRYDKSLKYLTESLELEPKNKVALKFLAQSYFELKRYKESSETLTELLKIDPKNAIALELQGISYYELENYIKSVKILTKLLNLRNGSKNNNALITRGRANYMLGNYFNCLKDLNKVLKINPDDAETLRARGNTYFKLGRYEESLVDLNKSLELEPDNLDSLKSRAKTYSELGRNNDLQADLDQILLIEERKKKEESCKNLKISLVELQPKLFYLVMTFLLCWGLGIISKPINSLNDI
ncbi:kinase-like domain-containing protein [Gigaspora rosea]|uniref:Kinase-like domain-containing protein n=1 Tax=Gigaspora rosea TaxID=44941 RepID=A0A397W374_9GLOM|nr:kinase-like domain-containing protein [Gigaspora rosea]